MKINEITNIDEAPAGMLAQLGRNIGSRVLNRIPGFSNIAANLAAKGDLGATANKILTQFYSYLGTQGKNFKTATGEDLIYFLKQKGVDVDPYNIPPQARLSGIAGMIDDVLLDIAKKRLGGPGPTPTPTPGDPDETAPTPPGGEPSPGPTDIKGKIVSIIDRLDDSQKEKLLRLLRQNQ